MAETLDGLLAGLAEEIARQDQVHPSGYPATRDGVFLGIHTAIHELEREAIDAWRADRCRCEVPLCGHATWTKTRGELVQAAAVILRTIRSIAEIAYTGQPTRPVVCPGCGSAFDPAPEDCLDCGTRLASLAAEVAVHQARVRNNMRPTVPERAEGGRYDGVWPPPRIVGEREGGTRG